MPNHVYKLRFNFFRLRTYQLNRLKLVGFQTLGIHFLDFLHAGNRERIVLIAIG